MLPTSALAHAAASLQKQDERILNEKRRFGNLTFDLQPIPTSSVSDLNLTQFENEYLPQTFAPEILAANERTLEERLAATKMIVSVNEQVATVLGILAFGKSPQDYIPGAYVQFLRIDGNELSDEILDSEDIRGAVPDLLRRLDDKLIAHNRIAVDFTTDVLEQRTEFYPIPALQQITRNAVMHRTYEATNAPVRVSWFNDRIEVLSPRRRVRAGDHGKFWTAWPNGLPQPQSRGSNADSRICAAFWRRNTDSSKTFERSRTSNPGI